MANWEVVGLAQGTRRDTSNSSSYQPQDANDIPESQQCLICAEHIVYAALTPCNHTTCHKCTFRQRALYEKNNCLICRSQNDKIIITEQLDKGYDDIKVTDIVAFDEKYHVGFTQEYVEQDTLRLLENECQICHEIFPNFKELGDHAKEAHGKYYCLICSRHKRHSKLNSHFSHTSNYKSINHKEIQPDLRAILNVNIVKENGFTQKMNYMYIFVIVMNVVTFVIKPLPRLLIIIAIMMHYINISQEHIMYVQFPHVLKNDLLCLGMTWT